MAKAAWTTYCVSTVAGLVYVIYYNENVIDQKVDDAEDASSGTLVRTVRGYGGSLDVALLIFTTGIAVSNLVQLFVAGKFVVEGAYQGKHPRRNRTSRSPK